MTNKIKRFLSLPIMILLTLILMTSINPKQVQASGNIKIIIDGEVMETDSNPIIINSRVLVPFRAIFEKLGSTDIEWINSSKKVKATINDTLIELQIDNNIAYVNKESVILDVPATINNGRTLVPIRFIAELTGENEVTWNAKKREVHITTPKGHVPSETQNNVILNRVLNKEISIGENVGNIIDKLGQPNRIDDSEQGFTWYIYNSDLKNYAQIGIYDNKVVAFSSNSTNWEYGGFKIGEKHDKLKSSSYLLDKDKYSITILSDQNNNNIVSTILIVSEGFSTSNYTEKVFQGLSLQLHDLINVYRVRNGVEPLKLDNQLTELAKYHTLDMATNGFFSHKSSNGDSFSTRANNILGGRFTIAENISIGYLNSIHSANGLYNSPGHRKNMLNEDYSFSGTHVAYGIKDKTTYYTHNFSADRSSRPGRSY